jgi:energy-coupling factor transporter ATP-binding protein EcfA2
MTPAQRTTVEKLQADGFQIVVQAKEIVRMTKGADRRVVMQDGSQKRASHVERSL